MPLVMSDGERAAFERLAARKIEEASTAHIEELSTLFDGSAQENVLRVGNTWTRLHYGGDFGLVAPQAERANLSLVFVQSSDRNTAAADPGALGAGATDQHLIYEGLSRVAADAVLAGAGSVHEDAFFSVWHPQLVSLRESLGLPRHPAQIVVSRRGRLDFTARLFNVPDVRVFLIGGEECIAAHAAALSARPWIRHVPLAGHDLRPVIDRLRVEEKLRRISAVGGRFTATRLVDAGLAQDIYLTTTSREGGEPGTPWYDGPVSPRLSVITRKQWLERGSGVVFEHILIN
jgi:riboflavin biosynthesis pyrimidine reductase